jgi:hypothetical protein
MAEKAIELGERIEEKLENVKNTEKANEYEQIQVTHQLGVGFFFATAVGSINYRSTDYR